MELFTFFLHALNISVACLCIVILGLTAYSVSAKERFENDIPTYAKSTGMSLLFWPGVGGIVDALLFLLIWVMQPTDNHSVSPQCRKRDFSVLSRDSV